MIAREDLPKLLEHWRTMPAHSDQVAAAQIISELLLEIRKLEREFA